MEVILGCLGFACVCGAGAAYQIISKKRRIAKMSDEELIKEYDSLVHKIELTTSTCNGLKGLGSNMATNIANNDIIEYRNQGKKIGAELESRGMEALLNPLLTQRVSPRAQSLEVLSQAKQVLLSEQWTQSIKITKIKNKEQCGFKFALFFIFRDVRKGTLLQTYKNLTKNVFVKYKK